MNNNDRKMMILKAIVDDYIMTGTPVGSRTISKRNDIHVSPATIRNDMADLEDEGYLEQPHTSAGRIPSDKAYRLYVDSLMNVSNLDREEMAVLNKYIDSKYRDYDNIIEATANILSDLTHLTSIVMAPKIDNNTIRRIQVVKISATKALVIIVFNTGDIKDVMINVPKDVDDDYLESISSWLSKSVVNKKIGEALDELHFEAKDTIESHIAFGKKLLNVVYDNMSTSQTKDIVLGGAKNIFNYPEYQDVDHAKNFLTLLETKDTLYDILSENNSMEFSIKIGKENEKAGLEDMSVITASYKFNDNNIGTFGVIGPTRMNYSRVVSILQYITLSLNEMFDKNKK